MPEQHQIPPGPRIILVAVPGPNNQVRIHLDTNCIEDWPLLYHMLDGAKQLIQHHHTQELNNKANILAAPAAALDQLPKMGANGSAHGGRFGS